MTNITGIQSYKDALSQYKRLDVNNDEIISKEEAGGIPVNDSNKNGKIEFTEFLELSAARKEIFKFNVDLALELKKTLQSPPYNWKDEKIDQVMQKAIFVMGDKWWYQWQIFKIIPVIIRAGVADPQKIKDLLHCAISASGKYWVYSWDSLNSLFKYASKGNLNYESMKNIMEHKLSKLINNKGKAQTALFQNDAQFRILLKTIHPDMQWEEVKNAAAIIKSIRLKRFNPINQLEIVKNRINNKPDGRPLAVVTYPFAEDDGNKAFDKNKGIFESLIEHGFRVMYYETANRNAFISSINEATTDQKASVLIVGGHGDVSTIRLDESIRLSDEAYFKKSGIGNRLGKKAKIILNSCSTGEGEDKSNNIANMFKSIFQREVIAPQVDTSIDHLVFKEIRTRNRQTNNYQKEFEVDVVYTTTKKYKSQSVLSLIEKAKAEYLAGKYREAATSFDLAIKNESKLSTLYLLRALVFIKLNKTNEAKNDLDKAISLNPNDPVAFECRSVLNREYLEDTANSDRDTNEAIELRKENNNNETISIFPEINDNLVGYKLLNDLAYLLGSTPAKNMNKDELKTAEILHKALIYGEDAGIKDREKLEFILNYRTLFTDESVIPKLTKAKLYCKLVSPPARNGTNPTGLSSTNFS